MDRSRRERSSREIESHTEAIWLIVYVERMVPKAKEYKYVL
jgi:hypothetical protein